MRHITMWSIMAAAVFTLVACHKKPPAVTQSTVSTTKTYQMSDGLQITPLEVEHNEIADILGIHTWRFHVMRPSTDTRIGYVMELRDKGHPTKEVLRGAMWSGEEGVDRQMVVVLYPLDDSLPAAERLRTYLRIGSSTSSSTRDNPMKGLGGSSRGPVAKKQEDESFLLMEFSQSGRHPDPNNTQLILTINAAKLDDNHR